MTTAYAAGALVHEGRLDAEIELLNKPFTYAELATRIRELLDRQKGQREIRILVVEDEFLLQMLVADVLAEAGCQSIEAGSASEGWAKFRAGQDGFAGAIIDLGLPDRRGDELVADIRTVRSDLPIVLATGYADDSVRDRFEHDDRLVILTKPFNPDALLAAFRRFGIRTPSK
jgi:DNA-binding response OmpR family regulator